MAVIATRRLSSTRKTIPPRRFGTSQKCRFRIAPCKSLEPGIAHKSLLFYGNKIVGASYYLRARLLEHVHHSAVHLAAVSDVADIYGGRHGDTSTGDRRNDRDLHHNPRGHASVIARFGSVAFVSYRG